MATLAAVASAVTQGQSALNTVIQCAATPSGISRAQPTLTTVIQCAALGSGVSRSQPTLNTAIQLLTDSPWVYLLADDGSYLTADDGSRILDNAPGTTMRGMCIASAALLTPIAFATDIPGAVYLTTDDGNHVTADDGTALLISSPQRGSATVRATLSTVTYVAANAYAFARGISLMSASGRFAATAGGVSAGQSALTTSIRMVVSAQGVTFTAVGAITAAAQMAVVAGAVCGNAATAVTGIPLAATVTGLTYSSVALGSGTSLTVTAAGLVSNSAALLTQTIIGANAAGFGSAAAQFSTGNQMAVVAIAVANAQGGLSASIIIGAQAFGLAQGTPALTTSVTVAANPSGVSNAQAALTSGSQLLLTASGLMTAAGTLQTAAAPYGAVSGAICSNVATLNGNVNLVTASNSVFTVTARLLTVLQPPGEFADLRWLRAPRGGDEPYAEFFQAVGEQLWYGVNWEDWLASTWEANSSATVGQVIRPTVANGLEFACITAGQTGAVEPAWATFSGGQTIDGTAVWQAQAISAASLDDTLSNSAFSAPAGITLDSAQIQTLRSYLIIETQAAVVGTDYDVLCTVYTQGGQQKIAKLRIKVR